MGAPILTPTGRSRLDARQPIKKGEGQPWLIGYRTKGGGYIVATDGDQSDSGKPVDLVYVHAGGGVVVLRPSASPELVAEIAEAVGGTVMRS